MSSLTVDDRLASPNSIHISLGCLDVQECGIRVIQDELNEFNYYCSLDVVISNERPLNIRCVGVHEGYDLMSWEYNGTTGTSILKICYDDSGVYTEKEELSICCDTGEQEFDSSPKYIEIANPNEEPLRMWMWFRLAKV